MGVKLIGILRRNMATWIGAVGPPTRDVPRGDHHYMTPTQTMHKKRREIPPKLP